ncbi:MAG: hypothetical protein D6755_00255 [Anaerolineae bacterium]|nr:MAG: hypothetical protein D6755_00255 [Anaerolineae bacterium]
MSQPVFAGLIVDEFDNPVETAYVGTEPCYVVDDAGFRRHIPAEMVDRQVLQAMSEGIQGHEDTLAEMAARQLGQDDIFSKAIIQNQLQNIEQSLEQLMQVGLPEEVRAYLGMMGFRIRINVHGEVLEVEQPGIIAPDDE